MPYTPLRLELDIVGTNINNRIIDEPYTLSGMAIRSIATNYGPFFANSLVVKDGVQILNRGMDYQIVELHQEATALYGKEISTVILIINPTVSSNVNVTYQALGGHFAYNDQAIANMYETVAGDNRNISWTDVINKPTTFTPAIHRHLLDDVYGFEPVVDVLERIKRAITIGQVSVVLEIVNNFLHDYDPKLVDKVFPVDKYMSIDHFMHFASQHKMISNISVAGTTEPYRQGSTLNVGIDTSRLSGPTDVYWELYNPDGMVTSFKETTGMVNTGDTNEIIIYIPNNVYSNRLLYLGVRLDPNKVDFDAVTYRLDILPSYSTTSAIGMFYNIDDLDNTLISHDTATDDELRLYYSYSYIV